MLEHNGYDLVDAARGPLPTEIERLGFAERLAENEHGLDVRILHLFGLEAGQELEIARPLEHALAIIVRRRSYDVYVAVDEVLGVVARGAKVEQVDLVRVLVEEEVRPVRVGLHDVPHEELAKTQTQYVLTDKISLFLR